MHYLPATGPDPEDYARELATATLSPPDPDDLGTVFVNVVQEDEDYWTAVWQLGQEHRDVNGSRAEVLAWARTQPAGRRWLFDQAVGGYVPLTGQATDA